MSQVGSTLVAILGASAYSWLIAAGMSVFLAIWLGKSGFRVLVVRHLVVFLVTFASFAVANGLALGGGVEVPWQLLALATIFVPAAALGFYGAYQATDGRRPWTLWLWPFAALVAILTMLVPSLWARVEGGEVVLGPVFMIYGLNYLIFAVLAFELTRDAVKEVDNADKRRSMLWLGLAFSFLPAYISTSELFFVDVMGLVPVEGLFFTVAHYMSVAAGVVLLAMFVLLARAAIVTDADEQKVDVAWFLLVLIAPGATVMVQLLFIAFDAFNSQMSVAVEGVWAIMFPMLAAFAVARYQSFGVTNDSRPGLRLIIFSLLFPLAFGLGWMAGNNSFPDTPTWLVGLIFVAMLLPFVKVLWRLAMTWTCLILGVPDDESPATEVQSDA